MSISSLSANTDITGVKVQASGGTEVTSGGYKYHTFTSSGTFTVDLAGLFEVLVIGGGGGGGSYAEGSGGGGAGGLFNASVYFSASSYTVTIGAGGSGCPQASRHRRYDHAQGPAQPD